MNDAVEEVSVGSRLGLYMGTNSIGWMLYRLEAGELVGVVDSGVRSFSTGRTPDGGQSLAVERRVARMARRRRDRFIRRRKALLRTLVEFGLMPEDTVAAKALVKLDPWRLRAQGLDEVLPLHAFGRAIFHMNQRRGFKSNRKVMKVENEAGKIKMGTARLEVAMSEAGARTFGEFAYQLRESAKSAHRVPPVRARMVRLEDGKDGYVWYVGRAHLESEFDRLWAAQEVYWPQVLSTEMGALVRRIIFHQRPLKRPKVGRCLFTEEDRIARAHPLTARRVVLETVNGLKIRVQGELDRTLSMEERNAVLEALKNRPYTRALAKMQLSFAQLEEALCLPVVASFSLDTEQRDGVACDQVRAVMAHPARFGRQWLELSWPEQWEVIDLVLHEDDEDVLLETLMARFDMARGQAIEVANAPLLEGYSRLGLTATAALVGELEADVVVYSEAVERCGWQHSEFVGGEALEALPYYGEVMERHVMPGTQDPEDEDVTRYGRIMNATVHIALGQLRRVVNRVIEAYGKPDEIVIEVGQELKHSRAQKVGIAGGQREARRVGADRVALLEGLGVVVNGRNKYVVRLWEQLGEAPSDRHCPYSGVLIVPEMLFDGSCEIGHVLPYSRTLDDSADNKVVCLRESNRAKGNQTPWEAWGAGSQWEVIEAGIGRLNKVLRWRFGSNAMERFEEEGGIRGRTLVDRQYIGRMARIYLSSLYGGVDGREQVWAVPGRLTEMLRRGWRLNDLLPDYEWVRESRADRTDYRHRAIDAAAVGATDRGLLKLVCAAASAHATWGAQRVVSLTEPPWAEFRESVRDSVNAVCVSHRVDHGRISLVGRREGRDSTVARLHNATAYGVTGETWNGKPVIVHRVGIGVFVESPGRVEAISDVRLREAIAAVVLGHETVKEARAAMNAFVAAPGPFQGVRRVRIREVAAVIEVRDRDGRVYKAFKPDSNYCFEVWELPSGEWAARVLSTHEAHQGTPIERPHPAARRVMRLLKRDSVLLRDGEGELVVYQVVKFSGALVVLVRNWESNGDMRVRLRLRFPKRRVHGDDQVKLVAMRAGRLKACGARRIGVDVIGRMYGDFG